MQIIFQEKTKASQPRGFEFPRGFAVTQNPKHYSNELETLNLIEKIIRPYVAMNDISLKAKRRRKSYPN